jgi:hypothetical protein
MELDPIVWEYIINPIDLNDLTHDNELELQDFELFIKAYANKIIYLRDQPKRKYKVGKTMMLNIIRSGCIQFYPIFDTKIFSLCVDVGKFMRRERTNLLLPELTRHNPNFLEDWSIDYKLTASLEMEGYLK